MEQIIVQLKDETKRAFLLELLGSLNFVEIVSANGNGHTSARANGKPAAAKKRVLSPRKREIVEGIKEALREVELYQQGKTKLQTAREMLEELKTELQAQ
ncbi:MAG: hypothetical protein ACK4Q5_03695 [Saprospiraceae bacterium]